jgi:prepilin-type N-terminal cleavage/methylation domain-containing protein
MSRVRMSRARTTRGFTLIEVMVACALLAVIIAASMGAFLSTNASANQSYLTANLQGNSRLSLDALDSDLRIAGLGASNGTVGIAPGGLWSMRVPTVYTSPPQTFTDPAGKITYSLRSVFIVGAEPATVGSSATGDGIEGVVTDPTQAIVACNDKTNTAVDCAVQSIGSDGVDHTLLISNGPNSYQPIMLHDHQRAAIIVPTAISGFTNGGASQVISFNGSAGPILPSPNPSAPFGFAQGFQVARLRVVHWYLKQTAGQLPRLYRSRPTLTTAAPSATACATPFIDETNDPNGVQGVEMGTGPVESLQLRFIFDLVDLNDPTKYAATDTVDPCSTSILTTMRQLREVRVQMVAIAPTQLKDSKGTPVNRFTTPMFEGTLLTPTPAVPLVPDAFPRRAYVSRVAPRNFVPYRAGASNVANIGP